MFNLLAGAFMSVASLFGGLFGAHASSTPPHMGPGMASSTAMHGMHMGSTTPGWQNGNGHMGSTTPGTMQGMMPGVMGIVTSVNGSTLTVEGKDGMQSATTTYTVDASAAKVMKQGEGTSTVSSIATGDHVMVSGTVSGTSIAAKFIIDGFMQMMGGGTIRSGMMGHGRPASSTPQR